MSHALTSYCSSYWCVNSVFHHCSGCGFLVRILKNAKIDYKQVHHHHHHHPSSTAQGSIARPRTYLSLQPCFGLVCFGQSMLRVVYFTVLLLQKRPSLHRILPILPAFIKSFNNQQITCKRSVWLVQSWMSLYVVLSTTFSLSLSL
jgi:hypothetical protein